jgi:uncharacterized protein with HEPN domain
MERDPRAYLWDVQQAANAIEQFIAGLDAAAYAQSALVRAAVERQFEIIGEALNQLSKVSPELARQVPNLREIIGFRNVLIHGLRRLMTLAYGKSLKRHFPASARRFPACWPN